MFFETLNDTALLSTVLSGIVILVLFILTLVKTGNPTVKASFLTLFAFAFGFIVTILAVDICQGTDKEWKVPFLHIVALLYYLFVPLAGIYFLRTIRSIADDRNANNPFFIAGITCCVISIIGSLVSCYPGLFYTITEDNCLMRAPAYMVFAVSTLLFFIVSLIYIWSVKKLLSKTSFKIFMGVPFLLLVGYLLQLLLPDTPA